jgi:hypothetical protein
MKTKTFEITVYEDKNGEPTCATNFDTGEVCIFYQTARCGTLETCMFMVNPRGCMSRRGPDGDGSLIPHDGCPIWGTRNKLVEKRTKNAKA